MSHPTPRYHFLVIAAASRGAWFFFEKGSATRSFCQRTVPIQCTSLILMRTCKRCLTKRLSPLATFHLLIHLVQSKLSTEISLYLKPFKCSFTKTISLIEYIAMLELPAYAKCYEGISGYTRRQSMP